MADDRGGSSSNDEEQLSTTAFDGDTLARDIHDNDEDLWAFIHHGRLHIQMPLPKHDKEKCSGIIDELSANNHRMARLIVRAFFEQDKRPWENDEWRTQTLAAINDPNSFIAVEFGTTSSTSVVPVNWDAVWEHGALTEVAAAADAVDDDEVQARLGADASVPTTYVRRKCDCDLHRGLRAFTDNEPYYHRKPLHAADDDDYDLCEPCFNAVEPDASTYDRCMQQPMPLWAARKLWLLQEK
jgi:hypothetical protein